MASESDNEAIAKVAVEISRAVDMAIAPIGRNVGDQALELIDEIREELLSFDRDEAARIELDRKVLLLRAHVECCRSIEELAHKLITGA